MYDQIKTGIRIRALRIKNHYTQAEMAEILNVSIQHFRGIEAGQRGCSVDILLEIAIIFQCFSGLSGVGTGYADGQRFHQKRVAKSDRKSTGTTKFHLSSTK